MGGRSAGLRLYDAYNAKERRGRAATGAIYSNCSLCIKKYSNGRAGFLFISKKQTVFHLCVVSNRASKNTPML